MDIIEQIARTMHPSRWESYDRQRSAGLVVSPSCKPSIEASLADATAAHSVIAGKVAELERALQQIEAGAINGKAEFLRRLGKRKQPIWLAVNVLEDYLAASGGTARAALAPHPERRSHE